MSELIINSDSNCPRDEWFAMPAEDMKWLAFGLYPPSDFADNEDDTYGGRPAGATSCEDEVCDRLAEIEAAQAEVDVSGLLMPTTVQVQADGAFDYAGRFVAYTYQSSRCTHSRVTESGFGSAWCDLCNQKLKRNSTSWEWESA